MFNIIARLLLLCLKLISNFFQSLTTFGCSEEEDDDRCPLLSSTTTAATSSMTSASAHSNQSHNNNNNNNHKHHQTNNGYSRQPHQPPAAAVTHLKSEHYTNGFYTTTNGTVNGFLHSNGHSNGDAKPNGHHHHQHIEYHRQQIYSRPTIPFGMYISNLICHGTLFAFGFLNDFLRGLGWLTSIEYVERNRPGYTKLYSSFTTFYVRNIIQRLVRMWSHPICSVPGAITEILERRFTSYNASWKFTGRVLRTINMGSYDYLGYSVNKGPRIDSVQSIMRTYGIGNCSTTSELGTSECHQKLEKKVAQFLGVEDSVVIGMGFATNALSLPCLFGPGSLVISDQHNHASLALGCKLSGAKVKVFKHNDMDDLERILRTSIVDGQPNSGEKWTKIIILVEGIYSMEGTIVNLPEVIRLKNRYKSYLYMDEAHSIGAMGLRGRGICDYYGCDPNDVDILMGTFTKSFAAAGGYIAGRKSVIDYIRAYSASFYYGGSVSPPIVEQINSILDDFLQLDKNNNNNDGSGGGGRSSELQNKITRLRTNVNMFRKRLKQLGFHIDGNDDSPVVPIMVYSPTNLMCLIAKLLKKNIASTGAAYPVTSLNGIRARFCLSAGHTDQMIDYTIKCLDEIGTEIGIKFNKPTTTS